MTVTAPPTEADLAATAAWSQRVRRVGGFIQLAFAAFWLIRGAISIGGATGTALMGVAVVSPAAVLVYTVRVTAGTGRRPTSPEAKRIERSVTAATIIELVASFALPVIVIAAGHSDWVLPSIAITVGPLLLWLDHLVHIPRYRPVGWALTIGPFILVATMSGPSLAATTGLAAGILLLGTAAAGFRDLANLHPKRPPTDRGHNRHDPPLLEAIYAHPVSGREDEGVLLTTIPAGAPVGAYGRESWVSV